MSAKKKHDCPIVGGETPYVPFSEAYRAFSPDHKPTGFEINGKEATREMHRTICAMTLAVMRHAKDPLADNAEFVLGLVASANHDLRCLAIDPLLSLSEIKALAEHPQIVAAVAASAPGQQEQPAE